MINRWQARLPQFLRVFAQPHTAVIRRSATPDTGHWSYEYYPADELWKQTDAEGNEVTFTYDLPGPILTKTGTECPLTPGVTFLNFIITILTRTHASTNVMLM
jgi:YD repeat-containing protein